MRKPHLIPVGPIQQRMKDEGVRLVRIRCFIVWLLFRLAIKVEVEATVEYARRVTVATADVGDEINVEKA